MRNRLYTVAALALMGAATLLAAESFPSPATGMEHAATKGKQVAVLAGGCFWCTEGIFEELIGVNQVISGYSGGDAAGAHYKIVSAGKTDHAEAIEITFDPSKISYGEILKVFFSVAHDPTTKDYQGPDHGRQYRSAIFYKTPEQKSIAEAYIKQLDEAKMFPKPIVTDVTPLTKFYPAEEYHQDFIKHNPDHPYVVANYRPKLAKLKKYYPSMIRK
jgi:peptide-methionine (S)-S-oxide reductase